MAYADDATELMMQGLNFKNSEEKKMYIKVMLFIDGKTLYGLIINY